jgi:hypothetical protein
MAMAVAANYVLMQRRMAIGGRRLISTASGMEGKFDALRGFHGCCKVGLGGPIRACPMPDSYAGACEVKKSQLS